MHHNLDIYLIPKDVLYVNELSLAGKYATKQKMIRQKQSLERKNQRVASSQMTM